MHTAGSPPPSGSLESQRKFLYPLHNPAFEEIFSSPSPLGDAETLTKLRTMGKQELVIKILSFVLLALHSDAGGAKPAGVLFFLRRLAWASLGRALLLLPHESAPGCLPRLAHRRDPSVHVCGTDPLADAGCSDS